MKTTRRIEIRVFRRRRTVVLRDPPESVPTGPPPNCDRQKLRPLLPDPARAHEGDLSQTQTDVSDSALRAQFEPGRE